MLDEGWIKANIDKSLKSHANVTDTVVTLVKELLSSPFVERQLTSKELKELSMKLIGEMVSNSPELDDKQ